MGLTLVGLVAVIAVFGVGVLWLFENLKIKRRR